MKDIKYKIKCMRLNERTWATLKKEKGRQSWNLFMVELLKEFSKKNKDEKTKKTS